MFLFGHIGLTTGVFKATTILASRSRTVKRQSRLLLSLNGIKQSIDRIDYRLVVLGSLLPDIIDKPVWFIAGTHVSLSGRAYAHTLLFNLALLVTALVLIKHQKPWLLVLSLSSFMHLVFDRLWTNPVVLLWPLFGQLPMRKTTGWLTTVIRELFGQPATYVPEIIGLVIILILAYRLVVRRSIINFLRCGAIE
ncbi:MAG: metal-dependent hydrolase [Chloroflexi bacterium]|nr:metal-dependent hydrolase [Chloroflexota bacterium]